jgi:hypothetical protein
MRPPVTAGGLRLLEVEDEIGQIASAAPQEGSRGTEGCVSRRVPIPPKPEPRFRAPIKYCVNCFTAFEIHLLNAMLHDATVKGVASRLEVSGKTIKFYRSQLCRKFSVDCFDNLLIYLIKLDLRWPVHAVKGQHKSSRPDKRHRNEFPRRRYFAKYRDNNREQINERTRRWYQRNVDYQRECARDKARRRYWLRKAAQGLTGNGR